MVTTKPERIQLPVICTLKLYPHWSKACVRSCRFQFLTRESAGKTRDQVTQLLLQTTCALCNFPRVESGVAPPIQECTCTHWSHLRSFSGPPAKACRPLVKGVNFENTDEETQILWVCENFPGSRGSGSQVFPHQLQSKKMKSAEGTKSSPVSPLCMVRRSLVE